MAFRTWGRLLLTALVVSLLAGAGQLGIAYGFGVVRLNGAFIDGSVNRWPAQLVWVAWFAAIAAVTGAVLTERFARRDGLPGGTSEQLAVAGAAALGAIVVAPLCMQPARAAELGGTIEPVWAVGICAILGAVVGAGAAIAVLLKPPLGWNIALSAGAVWLLALVSAAPSVASTGPLLSVRLGVLEPSWLDPAPAQRLAALIMPTVALLAGAAVGALARRRGHSPLVGGAAGAAGPILLAFAYLTAGPGVATDRYQLAPYYGALVAVAVGALGSAATTVLRRPVAETETTAIEPTDILQPLPSSPAGPGDPGFAAEPATDSLAAVERTAMQSSLPEAGREPTPRSAGAPTPAHWDWPRPSGLTPSPRPAHRSRADRTTPDRTGLDDRTVSEEHTAFEDRPAAAGPIEIEGPRTSGDRAGVDRRIAAGHAASVEPATPAGRGGTDERNSADEPGSLAGAAAEPEPAASPSPAGDAGSDVPEAVRDADDLTQTLPVPGLLPPRRRTAAIDVLAAGRPAPEQAVKPQESTAAPAPATLPERMPSPDVAALAGAAPSPRAETPAGPEPDHSTPLGEAATTSPTVPPGGGLPDHEAPARADGDDSTAPAPAARPTAGRQSRRQPRPAPAAAKAVPAEAGSGQLTDAETDPRTDSPAVDAAAPVQVGQEPAAAAPESASANPSAAEAAAGAGDPGSTSARPGSRSRRGRKTRTSPATATTPAGATSPAPASSTGATPAEAAPGAAASTEAKPAEGTPGAAPSIEAKPAQATRARRRPARTASTEADPARAPRIEADPAQAAPIEAPHVRATPEVPPADPHPAAPEVDVPARSASPATPPAPRAAGDLDQRPGGRTPLFGAEPSDATADPQINEGGRPTRSYFFSDDEPAATDLPGPADAPASPRPRFPIFEDVTDPPEEALPTGPVALPPSQPVGPRDGAGPGSSGGGDPTGATGSTTDTPDRTEAPTGAAQVEPMPRPRHRALPDLGREARWDAFANARQATPVLPNAPQPGGRHADTTGSPTEGEEGGEPGDGRSKLRGLFRRNRAKGTPGDAGRESESLAQDDEYVDWVAGLASDDGQDIPTLRGGRHHRD
ncbi:hypothetical protein [Micromonospora sp. CB01531]|uniref:hypothetical protein n=1 Tax=Micromonospora sp. CB01531 TaxID=1718947 RepID=UPI000938AC46|nr:hypothetical protein [Micromonospora sp. CB01531]OKI69031.1 hypothetical protein A6A27_04075 [Micromonospora sp. CB01531]